MGLFARWDKYDMYNPGKLQQAQIGLSQFLNPWMQMDI